jgi:predicted N-formylglutamate amidohydrolase
MKDPLDPAEASLPRLLAEDEPRSFHIERAPGAGPFLVLCDHAGRAIPRSLSSLGLTEPDLVRHIGWDIGAAGTARILADALGATLILQRYSRLVIDCNRPPGSPDSIVAVSERTCIPGNQHVTRADAGRREQEIFVPYHERIRTELDARRSRGQPTVLIAVHSFTPVYLDHERPWHIGVLYNRDSRVARLLLDALGTEPGLVVGNNEPYSVSDDTDYTIPEHGERRGLPHVEIEIRQDLIAETSGQRQWALRLARLLPPVAEALAIT